MEHFFWLYIKMPFNPCCLVYLCSQNKYKQNHNSSLLMSLLFGRLVLLIWVTWCGEHRSRIHRFVENHWHLVTCQIQVHIPGCWWLICGDKSHHAASYFYLVTKQSCEKESHVQTYLEPVYCYYYILLTKTSSKT